MHCEGTIWRDLWYKSNISDFHISIEKCGLSVHSATESLQGLFQLRCMEKSFKTVSQHTGTEK